MLKFSDHHILENHFPLPKLPLAITLVVNIEWEQLPDVRESARGRRSETYITVDHEVSDVPQDTFGDFLGQFTSGHGSWRVFVVLGGELSVRLLVMGRSWTFNLYTPALISPLTFRPSPRIPSASSQHGCWNGTLETGDKR